MAGSERNEVGKPGGVDEVTVVDDEEMAEEREVSFVIRMKDEG
jgi:hypothetical protein